MSGLEAPLTVRLKEDDLEAVGHFAAEHGFNSKSELVRTALMAFVEDRVLTDPKLYEDLGEIVKRLEKTLGDAFGVLSDDNDMDEQTARETLNESRVELLIYLTRFQELREALVSKTP